MLAITSNPCEPMCIDAVLINILEAGAKQVQSVIALPNFSKRRVSFSCGTGN